MSINNISIMEGQIFLQGITLEQLAEALKPLIQPTTQIQQTSTEETLLTRKEVCSLISINLTTLHKKTKSGELKSYGTSSGNRVLYKKSEVLAAVKPINHESHE